MFLSDQNKGKPIELMLCKFFGIFFNTKIRLKYLKNIESTNIIEKITLKEFSS